MAILLRSVTLYVMVWLHYLNLFVIIKQQQGFCIGPYMGSLFMYGPFFYSCDNPDSMKATAITGLINCVSINKHPITMITCPKCLSCMIPPLSNLFRLLLSFSLNLLYFLTKIQVRINNLFSLFLSSQLL